MLKKLIIVALSTVAIISLTGAGANVITLPNKISSQVKNTQNFIPLNETIKEEILKYQSENSDKFKKIVTDYLANETVTTPEIENLTSQINEEIKLFDTETETEKRLSFFNFAFTNTLSTQWMDLFIEDFQERVNSIDVLIQEHKSLVAKERERIAEEERIAAEKERQRLEEVERQRIIEAQRQAAPPQTNSPASSNDSPRTQTPQSSTTSSTAGESSLQRLQRIANGLPFYVPPIEIGNSCEMFGSRVVGCYDFRSLIQVTPFGVKQSECYLRTVIAHETRHYQQHQEGRIYYGPDGEITNRAELEADANSFGSRYKC